MYEAIVAKVATRPHPNADRLQLGTVCGNQVVLGLDIKDGELGIYFPVDAQIHDGFLEVNGLYPKLDENGRRIGGGFFDRKRRKVRAQNFRGEKSEGYWCSLDFYYKWIDSLPLGKTHKDSLYALAFEGNTIGEVDPTVVLSQKYFNEKTLTAIANSQVKAKKQTAIFPEHVKTKQFKYELGNIPFGSIIYLTEKAHGTSARYGYSYEPVEEPKGFKGWLRSLAYWLMALLGIPKKEACLVNLTGSRRVVLETSDGGFYGDSAFRFKIAEKLRGNLHPGEIIYGELVGWVNESTPIMARHDPSKVSKDYAKKYPNPLTYSYGCEVGESKFIVYRITKVDEKGNIVELTDPQMRARAKELGFESVHLLTYPIFYNSVTSQSIESIVDKYLERDSVYDSTHPTEGVVLRIETPNGNTYFLKDKSHSFKIMEGIVKESDVIDLEEVS